MRGTNIRKLMFKAVAVTALLSIGIGVPLMSCGGMAPPQQSAQPAWNPSQGPPPSPGGGSTSAPGPSSGCSKDTDCKGDRVCESGVCRAPQ
jgi:hypothetical protein